ncbi:MAG: DUF2793 domain-containing protein [Pseudomonadota bacterium]
MSQSDLLNLPYILPGQSQKHVIHNEAIRRLDAMVHLAVVSRTTAVLPQTANAGDRYIVPADAGSTWPGNPFDVVAWQDGAWEHFTPRPGWLSWVMDEAQLFVWTGTDWQSVSAAASSGPSSPEAPTLSLMQNSTAPDAFTVEWTSGSGDTTAFESEYQLSSASSWTQGPTAGPSDTALTIDGLFPGNVYRVRLRATGPGGSSTWSNTVDAETPNFTVFVDPMRGSDANPGSYIAPYSSLAPLAARLDALSAAETLTAYVSSATYTDETIETNGLVGEGTITFAPGCKMVWTQVGVSASAITTTGSGGLLTIFGNGLEISGYLYGTGNGIACSNTTLVAHDIVVSTCQDGMSAHGVGHLEAYRCRVTNCTKFAAVHVNTATSYHEDCFFQPSDGATGICRIENSLQNVFKTCTFTASPSADTLRMELGAGTELKRCEIGTLNQRVDLIDHVNAEDCFIHGYIDGNAAADLTRVFGKLSLRLRNGGQIVVTDSVLAGPATNDSYIYSNYLPGSFGDIVTERCVISGYGASAIELVDQQRLDLWNASASAITDCVFFNNASDFDAHASQASRVTGVSATDPGMGVANTLLMSDYAVTLAGVGFPAASAVDVGAPASIKP